MTPVSGLPEWAQLLQLPILGRLLLSLVLGAAIGMERELSGKPAGLRTNILICVGAELLTEASLLAAANFLTSDLVRGDPARIAAQIVSGIGFIGAGTILVSRGNVVGLTTAATLWVVAAIGVMVGLHAYVASVGATMLVVGTLVLLGWFERRVLATRGESTLRVALAGPSATSEELEALMEEIGLEARKIGLEHREDRTLVTYQIRGREDEQDQLIRRLGARHDVRSAALQ